MHKILISHEIPKALFPLSNSINDYPYGLAHLLMKDSHHYDEEYSEFYKQQFEKNAYSILDNSCFELGASIDSEILQNLCIEYKPTHLVLPDIMGQCQKTIEETEKFLIQWPQSVKVKFIAVLQGLNHRDYETCLDFYNSKEEIDIIAVNYRTLEDTNRLEFLRSQFEKGKLTKKIHLLGCYNPIEFKNHMCEAYKDLIHSVDTSSPIIHGFYLNRYDPITGTAAFDKPSMKLADNLDMILTDEQKEIINYNIKIFKEFFNHA